MEALLLKRLLKNRIFHYVINYNNIQNDYQLMVKLRSQRLAKENSIGLS
jgi:hypothetical protein